MKLLEPETQNQVTTKANSSNSVPNNYLLQLLNSVVDVFGDTSPLLSVCKGWTYLSINETQKTLVLQLFTTVIYIW